MSKGRTKVASSQAFVGLQYGYIVLPKDSDRDKFIEQCYRWERVSILIERGGGMIHECYITKTALSEVEFPLEYNKLGSCIVFLTDPFSGHPVIFGVLSKEDESQLLREGFFKLTKSYVGSVVTISGDAKRGIIDLSVSGGTVSQLNISVTNEDKTAVVNVRCNGSINIETENILSLKSSKTATLEVEETFKINAGSEAMVKGDELKTELDKTNTLLQSLIDIIKGASIPEPGNGSPSALQIALATAIGTKTLGDYSDIKSEKSFLD